MELPTLIQVVTILVSLSIAAERLVEIVKDLVPGLGQQNPDPVKEGHRKAVLHLLAIGAGILTAYLAKEALFPTFPPDVNPVLIILGLGLLASGGSGFWNTILSYLLKVKDIKAVELSERRLQLRERAFRGPGSIVTTTAAIPGPTQEELYIRVRSAIAQRAGTSVNKVRCPGSLDDLLTGAQKQVLAPDFQDIARTYRPEARITMHDTERLEGVLDAYNLVGTRAGFTAVVCKDVPPLPPEV